MDEEQHQIYTVEERRGRLRGWIGSTIGLLNFIEIVVVAVVTILLVIAAAIGLLVQILQAV